MLVSRSSRVSRSSLPSLPQLAPRVVAALRRRLLAWYARHARKLPWRSTRDPYAIWVSEVMLQQTQVATVVPYYHRFLDRFPSLESLAAARLDRVLSAWAGLGYYRRARFLREAARLVARDHAGRVPDDPEAFSRLPGVGRYTAGAVLSIAFDQKTPVLDGNVARVLARLFGLPLGVRDPRQARALWELAGRLLPMRGPGNWNQALMELGAVVCLPRSPRCGECPLARTCVALRTRRVDELPPPAARRTAVRVRRALALLAWRGRWLVERRSGDLLDGLWEPPGVELADGAVAGPALRARLRRLGMRARLVDTGRSVRHAITHRRIEVEVWEGSLRNAPARRPELRLIDAREPAVPLTALAARVLRISAAGALLGVGALLTGCAPAIRLKEPKPAAMTAPAERLSVATVPVTVELEPLRAAIDSAIPSLDDGWKAWEATGSNFKYQHYERRDPVTLTAAGATLIVTATVHFAVRGCVTASKGGPCLFSAGCGDTAAGHLKTAQAILESDVAVQPDWWIQSKCAPPRLQIDPCPVTAAQIDLSGLLRTSLTDWLSGQLNQLDRGIELRSRAQLRPTADSAWAALQRPMAVRPGIWLTLAPKALGVSSLEGEGARVTLNAQLVFEPTVIETATRPSAGTDSLPRLSAISDPPGLHIRVVGDLALATVADSLRRQLQHREFEWKGQKLRVGDVRVGGAGSTLVVAVEVSGAARGTVYLSGVARYDSLTDAVSIQNLRYSIDSPHLSVRLADLIGHSLIREAIEKRASWPMRSRLEELREGLSRALNRTAGRYELSGAVSSITPQAVLVEGERLRVYADLEGWLRVRVRA